MAAPICATSLAGPSRSSRDMSDACRGQPGPGTEPRRQSGALRLRFPPLEPPPTMHRETKKPRACRGFQGGIQPPRDQGALGTPILFQRTNQARRGSRKRPDQEPRGGQECKQDSEDDPDINAHQSSPAAALPTNSSLTDRIYFDDLVAQAPVRKPVPSGPRHCRDVAHCANRIGTDQTVFVLISTRGATRSPQRSLPCVGYLVQDVLHAWGLR